MRAALVFLVPCAQDSERMRQISWLEKSVPTRWLGAGGRTGVVEFAYGRIFS